jgi:single-strand DNA-binding protein
MNICSIIGRLTKDGDMKFSQTGTGIYKNTIAVNRKFKKDESDFINLLAFNKTAELMANHLHKGDQVGIEGHINTGSYEKDGQKRYTFEVVVDNLTFIGSKKHDKPSQKNADPFQDAAPIDDSELPF